MQWLPYALAYAGIAIFVAAVIARIVMWAKMPMHLRWELYPVAHEGKRADYGGSYLEDADWWKKPREFSLLGELKVMVPEMMFLVALREHNPKLWRRSFPFHFGLYLVIVCTLLMMGTALIGTVSASIAEGPLGGILQYLSLGCGTVGLALGIFGALGLLHRRLSDPALKQFAAPADIFNLVFFVVVFGFALASTVVADPDFSTTMAFVRGLVTFSVAPVHGEGWGALLPSISAVLLAALVAYIPLTHMSHFVGKYFAYHAIRWNDEPNLRGGADEAKINLLLDKPVSWAAPHIQGDGRKTWVDLATEKMESTK
jgi:nitrate reductase gamma subunit